MREKITRLPVWAVLLIAVAVMAGFLIVLNLAALAFAQIPHISDFSDYALQMLSELVAGLYALGMLALFGYAPILRDKGVGLVRGLYIGGFFVFYCCFSLVAQLYVQFLDADRTREPFGAILIFLLTMFLVGWTEEAVFRGAILNLLLDRFPKTKGGILAAILLDGAVFGLMHLVNVLSGASLPSVCVQALTAAALGVLFAAVYARTRSLWIVVAAHALIDFSSLLSSGIYGNGDLTDAIDGISAVNLIAVPVLLIPAIVLLRRSKLEEMVRAANGQPVYLTERDAEKLAVVTILLGVLSLLTGCLGYGLGIGIVGVLGATLSLRAKRENNGKATAGFALSAIGLSIGIMMFFILCCSFSMLGNLSDLGSLADTEALAGF